MVLLMGGPTPDLPERHDKEVGGPQVEVSLVPAFVLSN